MQSYRQCLVLGCGASCKNHPAERWFSIDSSEEKKPDLCKAPNDVTTADFAKNVNRFKFKVIFLENLGAHKKPGIHQLKELLADDGSLIFFGPAATWQDYARANLKIQYFMSYQNKTILVMAGASLKTTLELLRVDLSEVGLDKSFTKFMNLAEREINRLGSENQLPPLFNCFLAHLETYVALRRQRQIRNYFKDREYDKLVPAIEELLIEFAAGQKSLEDARIIIKQWKQQLPSSMLPPEQLDYTPLEQLLELGFEAMKYHMHMTKAEMKVEERPAAASLAMNKT